MKKRIYKALFLLGIFTIGSTLIGDEWKHYTTTNGLADNQTRALLADKDNQIWVATLKGVSVFNGSTWSAHFPGDFGEAIVQDKNGDVWMAISGKGLNKLSNGSATQYYNELSGAGEITNLLADSKGRIWASSWNAGVDMFNGSTWVNYNQSNNTIIGNIVDVIYEDSKGNIWFGSSHSPGWGTPGGLAKFDGSNWTRYNTDSGLIDNDVRSIIDDGNGSLWIGTSKGISKFDGKNWTNYNTFGTSANNRVTCIEKDHKGKLWFGTLSSGVTTFDGTNWKTITSADGLASNKIADIEKDQEGHFWFSYFDNGISKLTFSDISGVMDISNDIVSTFPVPLTNKLQVQSKTEIREVRIYNMIGGLVHLEKVNSGKDATVSTSMLPRGNYLFTFYTASGITRKRITKE